MLTALVTIAHLASSIVGAHIMPAAIVRTYDDVVTVASSDSTYEYYGTADTTATRVACLMVDDAIVDAIALD